MSTRNTNGPAAPITPDVLPRLNAAWADLHAAEAALAEGRSAYLELRRTRNLARQTLDELFASLSDPTPLYDAAEGLAAEVRLPVPPARVPAGEVGRRDDVFTAGCRVRDVHGGTALGTVRALSAGHVVVQWDHGGQTNDLLGSLEVVPADTKPGPAKKAGKGRNGKSHNGNQATVGECNCGADRTGPSAEAHSAECPAGREEAPPPCCHRCGSTGGSVVDLPGQADADDDLIPCDLVDCDLLVSVGIADKEAEHFHLCGKCHGELAAGLRAAQGRWEKPPKPKRPRKPKPPPMLETELTALPGLPAGTLKALARSDWRTVGQVHALEAHTSRGRAVIELSKKPLALTVTQATHLLDAVADWVKDQLAGTSSDSAHGKDCRDIGRWCAPSEFAGVTKRMAGLMADQGLRTLGDVIDRAATLKETVPGTLALVRCLTARARGALAAACADATGVK